MSASVKDRVVLNALKSIPPTHRRSVDKNRAIVTAARDLFLRQGFGATSMEAIAQQAQVSKATLYAHVKTKEALFAAVIEAETQTLVDSLTEPALNQTNPKAALTHIGRVYHEVVMSPRALALFRLVVSEGLGFPDVARAFHQSGPGRFLSLLATYLQTASRAGQLKIAKPRRAAEQFFGMIRGEDHLRSLLQLSPAAAKSPIKSDDIVADAVTVFLKAYGA